MNEIFFFRIRFFLLLVRTTNIFKFFFFYFSLYRFVFVFYFSTLSPFADYLSQSFSYRFSYIRTCTRNVCLRSNIRRLISYIRTRILCAYNSTITTQYISRSVPTVKVYYNDTSICETTTRNTERVPLITFFFFLLLTAASPSSVYDSL